MFMANDFIRPRIQKIVLAEDEYSEVREAAIRSHSKYVDEKEATEWDKFYDEKMRFPDWIFDRTSTPESQVKHCAVHDAESVFYLCLLFFSRLWPYGAMVKAGEVEQLKIDRGTIYI